MTFSLTSEQRELLVFLKNKSGGMHAIAFESALQGSIDDICMARLCNLINEEFMMEGIDENFEPTQYGRKLENLLDVINRSRIY